MYNVAPMWNILFPLTNQLMDILEAPITRSVRSGSKGLVTSNVQRTDIPSNELAELKALAYGRDVKDEELPFEPVTKQGRMIAAMFVQNDLRPLNLYVVQTRLGLTNTQSVKYHVEKNNYAFHIAGKQLVLGPR